MTLHGIVHGNIIRFEQPLGLADGAEVEVEVTVVLAPETLPSAGTGLRPPPGLGKGFITVIKDDEEHLKDFADYMP